MTNLTHVRGDTLSRVITIRNGHGESGIFNITDYRFWFTLKSRREDTDAEAVCQTNWTSHTNPTEGVTTLLVPASTMDTIDIGTYFYDIQMVKDGVVTTVARGEFEVVWNITDSTTV